MASCEPLSPATRRGRAYAGNEKDCGASAARRWRGGFLTPGDATEAFERALATLETERYLLRLYVAGDTPLARRAIRNAIALRDGPLRGRIDLELVDLLADPSVATDDLVLATPALIRRLPTPLRSVVGDLSESEKVLVGLAIVPRD